MADRMNRRAALGSFAAALLAVPAAARAGGSDAELLALQGPIDAAQRRFEAALDALDAAEEREMLRLPERPDAPEMTAARAQIFKEYVDQFAAFNSAPPSPERVAYETALRQWEQDKARAEIECGVAAAHVAEYEADEAVTALRDRIAATPAQTLAGLIFKATYAAKHDFDEDVMTSIVEDLLVMSEEV